VPVGAELRWRGLAVAILGHALVVVACGAPAPSESPSGGAGPSASVEPVPGNVELACGGEAVFPAEAILVAGTAETGGDLGAQALRTFLASPDGQGFPAAGWVKVADLPDRVEFVARKPDAGGWSAVAFTRQGENVVVDRAGDCTPAVFLGAEHGGADWWLDPAYPTPTAADTVIRLILRERNCASGTTPAERLEAPAIVYEPEAILVTIAVRERHGDQDCQGNPEFSLEITLEEAIGDRRLLDAGVWPPRGASRPPDS